ncbi:MAG: alpha-1,2-fucosyltransferase [Bacteroidota bacterium]
MIAVRLKGGMGNQLFQYAFGRRMAAVLNTELRLDLSSLLDRSKEGIVFREFDLDIFELKPRFLTSPKLLRTLYKSKSSTVTRQMKKRALANRTYIEEAHFQVMEDLLQNPIDDALYNGWWQSERYFEDIAETIREDLQFKEAILPISQELFQRIQATNSVCLNVRRTDFLTNDTLNATNLTYFQNATKYMTQKLENPHFYVFSDDMKWCEVNIKTEGYPITYVQHNMKGKKFGNYLQLMKTCKHFIIPNSSFAWWATWFNENPKKIVIAPKMWFTDPEYDTTDLVPSGWIRM